MKSTALMMLAATLLLGGCGRVAELRPAPGQPMPVKPLMARTTPTFNQLLAIPSYAKPDRIDELMKRSEPRPADPFDLPPATGGSAPSLPPGSAPAVSNQSAPTTPGD